jgi:hypothetical protein
MKVDETDGFAVRIPTPKGWAPAGQAAPGSPRARGRSGSDAGSSAFLLLEALNDPFVNELDVPAIEATSQGSKALGHLGLEVDRNTNA